MSTKIFTGPGNPRFPKSKQIARHDEYGKDKKGIEVCKVCWNVYFKKQWHHPNIKLYEKKELKGKKLHFVICPADKMTAKGFYEGEIQIQDVPGKYEVQLLNLITNFAERAKKRDPQDRIIEIKKIKNGFRIITTENQLAVRLAKKIKGVFNKVDLRISYASEPHEVVQVRVIFQ